MTSVPRIAILGANGLIGHRLAVDLAAAGYPIVAIARSFTPAQDTALAGQTVVRLAAVAATGADLARCLADGQADIVVNTIGVLQDTRPGESLDVHAGFLERLCTAVRDLARPALIVHLSVPGRPVDDGTTFSTTKRMGEEVLRASGLPVVLLRPGMVIARNAFGGSALLRSLAQLPAALPRALGARPCRITAISDIGRTVQWLAQRWHDDKGPLCETWDVMSAEETSLADVIEGLRRHTGGPRPLAGLPAPLLALGARAGDAVARLGWRPPVRDTALRELARGVEGDPRPWMAATGLRPTALAGALASEVAPGVQELWFARLYVLKPVILASLVAFWCLSGLIALVASYAAARGILVDRGFPGGVATAVTVVSSLADISVGLLIAIRRTAMAGLLAGIALALGYMAGAALLTPDLWIEPLGALVKTGPAIVLMVVALAILPAR